MPRDGAPGLACVRCQAIAGKVEARTDQPIPAGVEPLSTVAQESPLPQLLLPPLPQEDWQLEAELRYVERLSQAWKDAPPVEPVAFPTESRVAESEHQACETASVANATGNKPRFAGLAWTALSIGVMAFVCGGVLLAWSAIAGRQELWSIGLPLTLFGQAGLILGLVLQLESLWQTNRATSQTLNQLDGELHELRHSTTLLCQSRSTPSQSFYLHLAEGASPHLLLADLKGQLDLLSDQMSKRR